MVLGAGAQRKLAENDLELSLSMGEENARNSKGKSRILVVLGAGAQRKVVENELKLSLSIGRKTQGIPKENQGFWWSWVLEHSVKSQKMSLS